MSYVSIFLVSELFVLKIALSVLKCIDLWWCFAWTLEPAYQYWHSISMLDLCFEMQQNCLLYLTKIVSVLANYFYGCCPNTWQETSQGRRMICFALLFPSSCCGVVSMAAPCSRASAQYRSHLKWTEGRES